MTILLRPIITEKTLTLAVNHQYTFEVDRRANALMVGEAIKRQYNITALDVRMSNVRADTKRNRRGIGKTSSWKKALIKVGPKDSIPGFEIEKEDKTETDTHKHEKKS